MKIIYTHNPPLTEVFLRGYEAIELQNGTEWFCYHDSDSFYLFCSKVSSGYYCLVFSNRPITDEEKNKINILK